MRARAALLILWLLGSVAAARSSQILTLNFEWFDKNAYSLHLVIPPHLADDRHHINFFTELMRRARKPVPGIWTEATLFPFLEEWVPAHYHDVGLYTEVPNPRLEALLRKTNPFSKQRSAVLFITPRSNPRDIRALVRFDHQTEEHEILGIEEFLMELGHIQEPFPRPEPEFNATYEEREFSLVLMNGKFSFAGWHRDTVTRPRGTLAEVLNLNLVDPDLDFMPLLYLVAEALGLSQWGGKHWSNGELLGVDTYYSHFEGAGRMRLYDQMGWSKDLSFPNPEARTDRRGKAVPNFSAKITRQDYKNDLETFIKRRHTFVTGFMAVFGLDPSHLKSRLCVRLLTQPIYGADFEIVRSQDLLEVGGEVLEERPGRMRPRIRLRVLEGMHSPFFFKRLK